MPFREIALLQSCCTLSTAVPKCAISVTHTQPTSLRLSENSFQPLAGILPSHPKAKLQRPKPATVCSAAAGKGSTDITRGSVCRDSHRGLPKKVSKDSLHLGTEDESRGKRGNRLSVYLNKCYETSEQATFQFHPV